MQEVWHTKFCGQSGKVWVYISSKVVIYNWTDKSANFETHYNYDKKQLK